MRSPGSPQSNLMNSFTIGFLFSGLVLAGVFSVQTVARGEEGAGARPNVLVILVDDLGYGDLSSYGAKDLKTPAIDRIVNAGMRFNHFYANCPVCSPTRASLLSGRYPELVGVPGVIRTHAANSWGYLAPDAMLLPEVLQKNGYDTALVGKWHLGLESPGLPHERGFKFVHGFLGDMMDDYYHHRRHGVNYMRKNEKVIDPSGHATDLFTDWACEYLRGRKGAKRPFFLYLAYNAPHTPIQPPQDRLEKVQRREPKMSRPRAKLVALIEHLDEGIGRVIRTLKETELNNNTLVVFSSDNGGQLNIGADNGPLRDGKQSMYEGGLRVAAAAVWPGRIQPGSRCDAVLATMDLFPTVCAACDVKVGHKTDGHSFLPLLLGRTSNENDAFANRDLFFHRREGGLRYGGLTIHAVRRGDWKLLQNSPFAPLELYNLRNDPYEKKDLANTHRKKFTELSAALRLQFQRGGAVPWQPPARRDAK